MDTTVVQVRDVPVDVVATLKARAEARGQSLAAYLRDLQRILDCRWLHPGSVVVADNVRLPGAPKYRAYMQAQEGRHWRTVEHHPHLEYQSLIRDLVLESEYLGD